MRVSSPLLVRAALLSQLVASCAAIVVNNSQSYITKALTTLDGQTYVYDYAAATNTSKPTLLLLHGYPSSRHDWQYQIATLSAQGFGVLAPDLLGFGDSSKPTSIEAYKKKELSGDLAQILDNEGLKEYPKRFTKLVFVSVSYLPPGLLFDIDAANAQSIKTLGYHQFGYWYFFNSYDAADLIKRNLESFFHLAFHTNASSWGLDFADLGAARVWLDANITTELPSWLSADYKASWLRLFSQPDIVAATLNYYQGLLRGIGAADEAVLTNEDRTLNVPVLAIGAANDQVEPPETQRMGTEPWSGAGFEQRIFDSGHWVPLERGEELTEILIEFAGSW